VYVSVEMQQTSLARIEAEIVTIRVYSRSFKTVNKILLRDGRLATLDETAKLKAGIARFELLVHSASRLGRLH
jgi:hypothetical protein